MSKVFFLIDQNNERSERQKSLCRKSKKEHRKSNLSDFQIVNYLWRKYLWRFGVKT
jgi:DNA/RNA-binding domain of Phe-tRNA-synthetase-like protein